MNSFPLWGLAIAIFLLRITDVSLGTIRTLAIIGSKIKLAVVLGFFEILIWVIAISQVVQNIHKNFVLALMYAGGFALGNAVGFLIERKLGVGVVVLRIISSHSGDDIAKQIRALGQAVTIFRGEGQDGSVSLLYIICKRNQSARYRAMAVEIDPAICYSVERANEWNKDRHTVLPSTGWRAIQKKK